MFICAECGKLIEDGDFANWTEPHGEQLCGCPRCGGEVEEAQECAICGEYHLEDDLTNGVCKDCAERMFYYDTALKYLQDKKLLRDFFIVWYWQICDSAPDTENEEVDNLFVELFNQKVRYDTQTGKTILLGSLKEYVLDDIYDWTEFLRKEASANENGKD